MPPAFELHTNISALDKSLAAGCKQPKRCAMTCSGRRIWPCHLKPYFTRRTMRPSSSGSRRNVTYDAVNTEVDHGQLFSEGDAKSIRK
jgi:hypothetical protein